MIAKTRLCPKPSKYKGSLRDFFAVVDQERIITGTRPLAKKIILRIEPGKIYMPSAIKLHLVVRNSKFIVSIVL